MDLFFYRFNDSKSFHHVNFHDYAARWIREQFADTFANIDGCVRSTVETDDCIMFIVFLFLHSMASFKPGT